MRTTIKGSICAIITPFHEDGTIDWDRMNHLLNWHVEQQTDAIVIVGTTGESPTVTVDEHSQLIANAVKVINKRIPVIAGTGGNSTQEAIELTRFAQQVGADASLQVVPYYNKPTQSSIEAHFTAIAKAVDLPIILYNVPGRTVADMSNNTVAKLAKIPHVVGIKDATGNLERGCELLNMVPADFSVYSGDDGTAPLLILMGGQGNISVTANIIPKLMHELCQAALQGNLETVRSLQRRLLPLHKAMFIESNPIPVKWAMAQMGLDSGHLRLPLVPLSIEFHNTVLQALRQEQLIA